MKEHATARTPEALRRRFPQPDATVGVTAAAAGPNEDLAMKTYAAAAAAIVVSLGVAGGAVAADQTGKSGRMADKDLGKLSIDGAGAYQDIGLARLAIYDGKTDVAEKLVKDAAAALSRAKSDDAVFMKAEADLTPPKTPGKNAPTTSASKNAVAWVPVDGEFVFDETLTPAKAGAVDAANKHLHDGEPDKAKDALKVAAVDADYVMTLAPLEQTTQDVQKASQMLESHDYYGASQQLRDAQMGVRYDAVAFQDEPHAAAKADPGKSKG